MEINGASAAELPTSTFAGSSGTGIANDFDTFLSILTAQLQAQDPLDPADSTEFTNQIVNFAGVEQQLRTNSNLENILSGIARFDLASSASLLGHNALTESRVQVFDGADTSELRWQYGFDGATDPTDDVVLQVLDTNGDVVYSEPGNSNGGLHDFTWDGLDNDGEPVGAGTYILNAQRSTAPADGSEPVVTNGTVFSTNRITAVDQISGEPAFTIGGQQIARDEIIRLITDG